VIDAVAFCPAAPFLIPGIAALPVDGVAVRQASVEVTRALRAVDRVVVLTESGHPDVRTFGPGTPVGTAGLHRSDLPPPEPVRLPGAPGSAIGGRIREVNPGAGPDVGTAVGAHLLRAAGVLATAWAVEIPATTAPSSGATILDVAGLRGLIDGSDRIGILAMSGGATSHAPAAPLGLHPAAAAIDEALTAAIATGSPASLAGWLDDHRALADATGVRGRSVLAVVSDLVPGVMQARVLLQAAPFGVGYVVAQWVA